MEGCTESHVPEQEQGSPRGQALREAPRLALPPSRPGGRADRPHLT